MGEPCAICLNDTQNQQPLLCGHAFHGACVDPWLLKHGSCPLCRARDCTQAIIYASDFTVAAAMDGFKPVSQFCEAGVVVHGWVLHSAAELAQMNQYVKRHEMVFMQLTQGGVFIMFQKPQQPPYGDFFVS